MAGLSAEPVDRVLALVDRLIGLVIVICVGGMLVVVASQVFARYVLNSSFGWADEISRLFFVWSIFLAIPLGIRASAHIGIELLTSRLPTAWQTRLQSATAAVAALLMILVAWQAFVLCLQQWDELMISVDISNAWFLVALVIGGIHGFLHLSRIALFGKYAR